MGGEGRTGDGRRGEERGGEGKGHEPPTIWRKFTPMRSAIQIPVFMCLNRVDRVCFVLKLICCTGSVKRF